MNSITNAISIIEKNSWTVNIIEKLYKAFPDLKYNHIKVNYLTYLSHYKFSNQGNFLPYQVNNINNFYSLNQQTQYQTDFTCYIQQHHQNNLNTEYFN